MARAINPKTGRYRGVTADSASRTPTRSGGDSGDSTGLHPRTLVRDALAHADAGSDSSRGELTERQGAAALDTLTDAVVVLDPDGVVRSMNTAAIALFGLSGRRLTQAPIESLLPPATAIVVRRHMHSTRSVPTSNVELFLTDSRTWLSVRATRRDDGVVFVFRDETQDRLERASLRAENRVLELVAVGAPLNATLGVLAAAIEERVEGSHCVITTVGQPAPAGLSSTYWTAPAIAGSGEALGSVSLFFQTPRAPASDDWALLGRFAHLAAIAIGAAHRASGQLPLHPPPMPPLLDDAPVGIALDHGADGTLQMNAALASLASAPIESFPIADAEAIAPSLGQHVAAMVTRARESGIPVQLQISEVAREGSGVQRHWLTSAYPVETERGTLTAAGLVVDVTRMKVLENTLRREVDELSDAVRQRDESMSIVCHEIKTPLTSLQLVVDGLLNASRNGALAAMEPREVTGRLEIAARQNRRLTQLVNKLLDAARASLGRLQLEPEELDLTTTVREVLARHREDIAAARCTLSLADEPDVVGFWDRMRIEQVVTNLVSNAIKYGRGALVEVTLRAEGTTAVLQVRDHGIGIEQDRQARIFERFERAVTARQYAGLGLGLFIVRQIIEAHSGTVEVESAPGQGSVFTVRLPLGPVDAIVRA